MIFKNCSLHNEREFDMKKTASILMILVVTLFVSNVSASRYSSKQVTKLTPKSFVALVKSDMPAVVIVDAYD